MRFLANENFPFPSITFLRDNGYSIIIISEVMPGVADDIVLQKAIDEHLIILTFDSDYGELIYKYKHQNPPAVVYFRTKGQTPIYAGELLHQRLIVDKIQLENLFTVLEDEATRQRKLK